MKIDLVRLKFIAIATLIIFNVSGASSSIYFNGEGAVYRINNDGTGFETVISAAEVSSLNDGRGNMRGLAVDPVSENVYFSIVDDAKVLSAGLDGGDLQILLPKIAVQLTVRDIEIDLGSSQLYFSTTTGVERSNLDGTNLTLILSEQDPIFNFGLIVAIAIDPNTNMLFATGTASNSIVRSDLSGNNPQTIIQFTENVDLEDIEVDTVNQKIYWTDSLTGKMQRANYDGTNIEDILTSSGPEGVFGRRLALDAVNEKVYWSGVAGDLFGDPQSSGIFSANLDGTDLEVIFAGSFDISGLDFGPNVPLVSTTIPKDIANVPEPATLVLFGVGLLGLGTMRRRRKST